MDFERFRQHKYEFNGSSETTTVEVVDGDQCDMSADEYRAALWEQFRTLPKFNGVNAVVEVIDSVHGLEELIESGQDIEYKEVITEVVKEWFAQHYTWFKL